MKPRAAKILFRIADFAVTAALLWRVWMHVDWSVALVLTGLSVAHEIQVYLNNERSELLMEVAKRMLSPEAKK